MTAPAVPPPDPAAITRLAADLPPLFDPAMSRLLGRRPGVVEPYLRLQADIAAIDLAGTDAADVQRRFNGYYQVRRNAAWRAVFYRQFEAAKPSAARSAALFAEALGAIETATGRVEASFASKLVASLRPEAPVIDSIVRQFLAPRLQNPRFGRGLADAVAYYEWLESVFCGLRATPQARSWCETFDAAFRDVDGASAIPATKKIDFLIWGGGR